MMDTVQQLHQWADELHAIANEGLRWGSDNPYNQQRFTRVRRIAAELLALHDPRDADQLEQVLIANPEHLSPNAGGDAAVINAQGAILLIQRADNALWAMPGGLLEVGEAPAAGTCREAWEETGLRVAPLALVGVFDSRRCGGRTSAHLYHYVFLCRPSDPAAQPIVTNETLAVGWFDEQALPPLSPGHATRIAAAFRTLHGTQAAYFDPE